MLSTYQLSPAQGDDACCDLLTGFHLVDGNLRLVVLEGPAAGKAMSLAVPAIVRWVGGWVGQESCGWDWQCISDRSLCGASSVLFNYLAGAV
jgi:hypothetical protein